MFLKDKDNNIRIIGGEPSNLLQQLDTGIYNLKVNESFFGKSIELIPTLRYNVDFNITAGVYDDVVNYVNDFIDPIMIETRKELNKINKLGLLFNGDPGTGKTFLAGQLGYYLGKVKNAVTIIVEGTQKSFDFASLVDQIREYDKNRFIVIIFDEFEKDYCNTNLLSFLDGASSKENSLIIATTNNTNNLPKWVVERPGRFERIYEFSITDKVVFESIVNCMLPEIYHTKINIDDIYNICVASGLTIDNIGIEVRNALFRYKKQLIDPKYIESNPYKIPSNNTQVEKIEENNEDNDYEECSAVNFVTELSQN